MQKLLIIFLFLTLHGCVIYTNADVDIESDIDIMGDPIASEVVDNLFDAGKQAPGSKRVLEELDDDS